MTVALAGVEPLRPPHEALVALRAEPGRLYAVVDPAQDEEILGVLRRSGQPSYSLYDGWAAVHYRTLCPYLVALRKGGRLVEQLVEQGWGRAWGIFLTSDLPLPDVRRHLRRMLKVKDTDKSQALCRFYDPLTIELMLTDPERAFEPWLFARAVRAYVVETHLQGVAVFRPEGTLEDVRWPIELTHRSAEGIAHRRREFFIDQIERHLRENAGHCGVRLPLGARGVASLERPLMRKMIGGGVRRAGERGLTDAGHQLEFVTLMFMLAPNFDEHLAVREILPEIRPGDDLNARLVAALDTRVWDEAVEAYDPAAWGLDLADWSAAR
jgi:hypothetical protein